MYVYIAGPFLLWPKLAIFLQEVGLYLHLWLWQNMYFKPNQNRSTVLWPERTYNNDNMYCGDWIEQKMYLLQD